MSNLFANLGFTDEKGKYIAYDYFDVVDNCEIEFPRFQYVEQWSVDSLRFRIPINEVTILNYQLDTNFTTIANSTAEVIDEFKNTAYCHKSHYYETWYKIEEYTIQGGIRQRYLVVLVSSKILEKDYLHGLKKEFINTIYSKLMSHKVARFTYESYMAAQCTDIDIKFDIYMSRQVYHEFLTACRITVKESPLFTKGVNPFGNIKNNKRGWALQFSKRTSTKFKTNPFMKIYHKGIQMFNLHKEYQQKYVDYDITDLVRTEVNIKNKEHLQFLLGDDMQIDLETILNLTQQQFKKIATKTIDKQLDCQTILPVPRTELSPTEQIIINSINFMRSNTDLSERKIKDVLLTGFNERKKRSKQNIRLTQLMASNPKMDKNNRNKSDKDIVLNWFKLLTAI